MRRSGRRFPAQGHGRTRYSSAASPRGSDVAVTCRDRVRGPVLEDGPAARVTGPPAAAGSAASHPGLLEVVLGAELVAARTVEIRAVVDQVLRAAPAVLRLRLEEVQRFDAAGVGLLLGVHQRARQQGVDLICTCPPRQLVAVLRRTRLDRVRTVLA
jgi:anti-anti-sigma factor